MVKFEYFIDSALFTWILSLSAFLFFLSEETFGIRRNKVIVILPKLFFYQAFLFEILFLKYKKHRLSITPALINIFLRNFIVHIVFGVLNYSEYASAIHICWFLLDTFKFIHIFFNNPITGILKYFVTIPIFIIHGFLECMSILKASFAYILPLKIFFVFVFCIHLISLKIVLKHKILQLLWYRKSKSPKKMY